MVPKAVPANCTIIIFNGPIIFFMVPLAGTVFVIRVPLAETVFGTVHFHGAKNTSTHIII